MYILQIWLFSRTEVVCELKYSSNISELWITIIYLSRKHITTNVLRHLVVYIHTRINDRMFPQKYIVQICATKMFLPAILTFSHFWSYLCLQLIPSFELQFLNLKF